MQLQMQVKVTEVMAYPRRGESEKWISKKDIVMVERRNIRIHGERRDAIIGTCVQKGRNLLLT
jgi:hypothetical protein